jgi:hypothetical protein
MTMFKLYSQNENNVNKSASFSVICCQASIQDPSLSVASVASTSEVYASAMSLFRIVGSKKYEGGWRSHKVHTKFRENRSPDSKVGEAHAHTHIQMAW